MLTLAVFNRDVLPQGEDESRYEIVDPTRREVHLRRRRRFDRIAFAMTVLDVLKPREKVVVYRRREQMVVERGSHIRQGRRRPYTLIGIPLGASRHQIAYELACLVGLEKLPFSVSALVMLARRRKRPRRD